MGTSRPGERHAASVEMGVMLLSLKTASELPELT